MPTPALRQNFVDQSTPASTDLPADEYNLNALRTDEAHDMGTANTTALAGKQPLDTDLTAIAALPSAANKVPYATGAGAWALADLSAFARTFLDDADAATVRATLGVGTGGGDASTNTSSSVDSELVLFSGTAGKTLKRATLNGLVKATSGVASAAAAGTDYYAPSGTDVAVADGGTGRSTGTTAYGLLAAGTTATGVQQTLAAGATTEVLVGGGAAALPVWTTASGSGAPVRATGPTLTNPTITNYTESVVASGVVTTTKTLDLTSGTVQTATLTASTACVFTMPTATAGKSFTLLLKQAATTGNGTATFTGVKWPGSSAPVVTATAARMDIFTFASDGTNWYGSYEQNYTP